MKIKKKVPRYGIAEWYGQPFPSLIGSQRRDLAAYSLDGDAVERLPCPFLRSIICNATCNKPGGVCSIRRYVCGDDGGVTVADDRIVTVCPLRFLEGVRVLRWIGETILGTANPILVKEVPFLEKLSTGKDDGHSEGEDEDAKKAGRIDWILVNPDSDVLQWCAVETQSVYFSGKKMPLEFESYLEAAHDNIIFPLETRRPDYRSSGPKRLAPQLQVKVPELRNWGKKTAVVIDRYFFDNMSELTQVVVKGGHESDLLDNSEIVWFVVDYEPDSGSLYLVKRVYTRLDESVKALNATRPIGKKQFEDTLRLLIASPDKQGKKVFTLG